MKPTKLYVASSWRNPDQPQVIDLLRAWGHEVYDFRNPAPGNKGFAWRDVFGVLPPDSKGWALSPAEYATGLQHPVAVAGYELDRDAIRWCEELLMLEPCGKSASWELGYAFGLGKSTAVLLTGIVTEPELMPRESLMLCGWHAFYKRYMPEEYYAP